MSSRLNIVLRSQNLPLLPYEYNYFVSRKRVLPQGDSLIYAPFRLTCVITFIVETLGQTL